MITYVCLLRGINVGGHKKIRMADLKEHFIQAGFKDVRTYIQSGNIIFKTPDTDRNKLNWIIQTIIQKNYGFEVETFLRTCAEIETIISQVPAFADTDKILVTFLSQPVTNPPYEEINTRLLESEEIVIKDDTLYFYCPTGLSKSKMSNNFIEKKLRIHATTRNWRTLNKLRELTCD